MGLMGLFKLKPGSFPTRVYTITTCVVIGCLLSYPTQIMAEDDAYLRELEAEAKKLENLSDQQSGSGSNSTAKTKKSRKQSKKNTAKKSNSAKAQAQLEKFEQLLQFERPSTYRFYKRLDLSEKKQVIKNYNKTKKICIRRITNCVPSNCCLK